MEGSKSHKDTFLHNLVKTCSRLHIGTILLSAVTTLCVVGIVIGLLLQSGMLRLSDVSSIPLVTVSKEGQNVVPDVVDRVAPAVVSIIISAEVPLIERYFEEYDPFDLFFAPGPNLRIPRERQLGTEKREIGGGSGFFVSADGYIVTNRHVVDVEGGTYSIVTNDGTEYEVEVIAKDAALDVAILKVKGEGIFPYLQFGDSTAIRLGSTAIAIGNALAELRNSVSVGVISGLARNIVAGDGYGSVESLEGVIQTDAAINQGNSGGPLLNLDGEVIGVNVAVAGDSENIGFALPSASVKNIFESVKEYGKIIRPFIGIRYQQISDQQGNDIDTNPAYGVRIIRGATAGEVAVLPHSPADKAGLKEGDVILTFDGVKLDGRQSLASLIRQKKVGDTITLTVLQEGEVKEVSVVLDQAPSE